MTLLITSVNLQVSRSRGRRKSPRESEMAVSFNFTIIEGEPTFAQRSNCCDCKLMCKVTQKLCSSIFRYDYGDGIHCFSTGMDSPDYSLSSNREYQLHWMWAYLEESAALSGIDHSLVSEADVESLFLGSAAFCPCV